MSVELVIGLLLTCGVCGFAGAVGQWVGANIMSGFAVVAAVGAFTNGIEIHWLQVVAPIATAYAAAGLSVSLANSRSR